MDDEEESDPVLEVASKIQRSRVLYSPQRRKCSGSVAKTLQSCVREDILWFPGFCRVRRAMWKAGREQPKLSRSQQDGTLASL